MPDRRRHAKRRRCRRRASVSTSGTLAPPQIVQTERLGSVTGTLAARRKQQSSNPCARCHARGQRLAILTRILGARERGGLSLLRRSRKKVVHSLRRAGNPRSHFCDLWVARLTERV